MFDYHLNGIVGRVGDSGRRFPDSTPNLSKRLFFFPPYQVCELDIIFNFEKAYFILDEFIIGGEIQETSKKTAVKAIEDSDMLQEVSIVFIPGKDDVDSSTNYNIATTLITTPACCAGHSFYFKQCSRISLLNSFSNSNQVSGCFLVSEQRLGR